MSEKIDETLKKIAAGTSKANTPTSSSTEPPASTRQGLPGDPNCPVCGGVGYLRADLPVGHPNFGRVQPCTCRTGDIHQQVRQRLYALSNLEELSHLTFDNFQPRGAFGLSPRQADSVEQAYNQAQQYAQALSGWLVLKGGYGCGKTHLAAAIANFAVQMGVPTLFLTVPDLLDSLRFSYQDPNSSFEERFEEIRNATLLILDDFGTENATPWAKEKLFQILNHRYINHLATVVTTNLAIEDLDPRLKSRLQDPELVTYLNLLAPDHRQPTGKKDGRSLSSLGLLYTKTFANFENRAQEGLPGEHVQNLERAFQRARSFAERPVGWLLLLGSYGCGKTHLAAAIANYRKDLGEEPLFVVVPDLLDHLRATFSPSSTIRMDRLFEEVRTAPLLILDDLGTEAATPWVREKLYQLFNYRYNDEKPTVITTANSLEEIDARIRARMLDRRLCDRFLITAPSYSGGSSVSGSTTPEKPRRRKN